MNYIGEGLTFFIENKYMLMNFPFKENYDKKMLRNIFL
ncbi:hypothetical protein BTJ45_01523 [Bacillus mycoides]|nr:hypothetical protein BTJ45_01523 [Bacillus mycoides]